MSQATPEPEKLSMTNTKKEMLDAYKRLLKQLTEKRRAELKPAEAVAEKTKSEAKQVADSLSTDDIGQHIGVLKSEIGRNLNQLADRLDQETSKYAQIKKAVAAAETELQEVYEIEKAASSLAALLEAQKQKHAEFEAEMARSREEFESDIKSARDAWKQEKSQYEATIKERNNADQKQREREKEEYKYQFEREKQLTMEKYEHDKAKLEREIKLKREEMEQDLAERENAVVAAETELQRLREIVDKAPGQQEQAVKTAVKEVTERLQRDSRNEIELLKKEFAGERNVLNSRIESLQEAVEQQTTQISKLSQQLENSYRQVQDIAVKAIEGPSTARAAGVTRSIAGTDPSAQGAPNDR